MAQKGQRRCNLSPACYGDFSEKTKLEARNNLRIQCVDEVKFKEKLLQINPAMPLAQIPAPRTSDKDKLNLADFNQDLTEATSYL